MMTLQSGFAPFGVVVGNGMDIVDRVYSGYGEGVSSCVLRLAVSFKDRTLSVR